MRVFVRIIMRNDKRDGFALDSTGIRFAKGHRMPVLFLKLCCLDQDGRVPHSFAVFE